MRTDRRRVVLGAVLITIAVVSVVLIDTINPKFHWGIYHLGVSAENSNGITGSPVIGIEGLCVLTAYFLAIAGVVMATSGVLSLLLDRRKP